MKKEKLEEIRLKLQKRYQYLFNKTVQLIQEGDIQRATIYAEEAAFVRRLLKIIDKALS